MQDAYKVVDQEAAHQAAIQTVVEQHGFRYRSTRNVVAIAGGFMASLTGMTVFLLQKPPSPQAVTQT